MQREYWDRVGDDLANPHFAIVVHIVQVELDGGGVMPPLTPTLTMTRSMEAPKVRINVSSGR